MNVAAALIQGLLVSRIVKYLGLAGALLSPERSFWGSLGGVLMGGGFLWAVAYFYYLFRKEEGMGGGDIKLLAWCGAVLGWTSIPFIILFSSLVGSLVGLVLLTQGKGLKASLPFGPYIAAAAIAFVLGGHRIALWYLHLFWPWLEGQLI